MQLPKTRMIKPLLAVAAIYITLHAIDQQHTILPIAVNTKKIAWTIFLIAGTILLYIYASGILKKQRPPIPGKLPGDETLQTVVLEYGGNRIGDIDKMLIAINGTNTWLHFPPHTAKYMMALAPKNAQADVSFHRTDRIAADNIPMFDLLVLHTASGSFETRQVPPPPPAGGKPVEMTGTIIDYKLDEKGMVAGFTMGQYLVEIPKHMEQDIGPLLKAAKEIIVKGYERNPADGFVNISGRVLVKPFSISIDKTIYLL